MMQYLKALGLCLGWCLPTMADATTYYVSGTGNDANSGLSAAEPLLLLQTAANLTKPGDVVEVMNGRYTPASAGDSVLNITTSGTASHWITFKALSGQHPVIDFTNGWAGIQIDAAYIRISGFEVAGGAKNVTLAYAKANAKNLSNYLTSANGIIVNQSNNTVPHHIIIENNFVHDAPGGGISTCYADYITIQHNVTVRNAFWSPYANSGISIWEMRDIDNNSGYKNYILDNESYDNQEFIPFYAVGKITDGNGIIVDDNKNTQSQNGIAYIGRTYVANNISYRNGGSGIHTYSSQHVDIVNNTAWMNNRSTAINEGQIFANSADDVNILNNISVSPAGKYFYSRYNNGKTVLYAYNILFSLTISAGRAGAALGPHDRVADPLLLQPLKGEFELTAQSPAIGSGTSTLAPSTDYAGNPRPSGQPIDRGAYQFKRAAN
jgi:hypothetical protein